MDVVEPFMALVIYPTTADAQERQAGNLIRAAADQVRLLPGFLRARVLVSEDGETTLHPKSYWLRQHAAVEAP